MERFTTEDAMALISPRPADSHKGTYGHGLLITGSYGMAGDMAADALSQTAMTATDIISFLPEAWSQN